MDKVSVVIPTYNRENTLLRALRSVLQQTQPVHEILVCDDGSTDNSKQKVEELNDPRIKWIDCGHNGRPSIPRNKGIAAASGEWIAFLDSDDEWLPAKTEVQLKHMREKKSLASSTNIVRIVNGKDLGAFHKFQKDHFFFSDLLSENNNACSSVMVAKKLLKEVSLFPEGPEYKAIEDYALWLRLATRTPFTYISEALVRYYDEPQASIRSNYTSIWELRKVVYSGLLQWLGEHKVILDQADAKKLNDLYALAQKGGKQSVWKTIKQKFLN